VDWWIFDSLVLDVDDELFNPIDANSCKVVQIVSSLCKLLLLRRLTLEESTYTLLQFFPFKFQIKDFAVVR
jgi:hypothetical protein